MGRSKKGKPIKNTKVKPILSDEVTIYNKDRQSLLEQGLPFNKLKDCSSVPVAVIGDSEEYLTVSLAAKIFKKNINQDLFNYLKLDDKKINNNIINAIFKINPELLMVIDFNKKVNNNSDIDNYNDVELDANNNYDMNH